MNQGLTLPDSKDRGGATRTLVRLQRAYNVSIDNLTQGLVRGHRSSARLDGRWDFSKLSEAKISLSMHCTYQAICHFLKSLV